MSRNRQVTRVAPSYGPEREKNTPREESPLYLLTKHYLIYQVYAVVE